MKTYHVYLVFERRQTIEVEANSAEEAREIVESGDFADEQIVDTEDDYVDIVGVDEGEMVPTNGFDGKGTPDQTGI